MMSEAIARLTSADNYSVGQSRNTVGGLAAGIQISIATRPMVYPRMLLFK